MGKASANDIALILRAAHFACTRHTGQSKQRQKRPIADHCLEVALLVDEAGLPPAAVAAAMLHDTLEKTETAQHELEAEFGSHVRELVEAVTDLPWETEEGIRARLAAASAEAQSIKCADIVSNLEALARVGELTPADADKKAGTLAVLKHAEATLLERATRIIARGRAEESAV